MTEDAFSPDFLIKVSRNSFFFTPVPEMVSAFHSFPLLSLMLKDHTAVVPASTCLESSLGLGY